MKYSAGQVRTNCILNQLHFKVNYLGAADTMLFITYLKITLAGGNENQQNIQWALVIVKNETKVIQGISGSHCFSKSVALLARKGTCFGSANWKAEREGRERSDRREGERGKKKERGRSNLVVISSLSHFFSAFSERTQLSRFCRFQIGCSQSVVHF